MAKSDVIEVEGVVTATYRGTQFKVALENGHEVMCTISGKLRTNYIRIVTGDRVRLEMSPYDLEKGRIIWRNK